MKKAVKSPKRAFRYSKALFKGSFYIFWYRVFRRNVKIKFPFFVYGKIIISGSGSVMIDKNCVVRINALEHTNIIMLSPEANVKIGKQCLLGGLTIRCYRSIEIKDKTMTAANLVQDFIFYSNPDKQMTRDLENSRSIIIGKNVWLGGFASILGGSMIGNNSVLAAHSVCYNYSIPDNSFASGNPIKRTIPISRILKFSKLNDN